MNIFVANHEKIRLWQAAFNMLLLCVILVWVFWLALSRIGVSFDFSFLPDLRGRLFSGFLMTVALSLSGMVVSLLLGIVSAVGQSSRVLILRYLAKLYVTFIRGTPLIMQIYLFFYIVGTAFGIENRFICGVLILSIFEGAYIAEIVRGSLLSMDETQLEAAKAVGFTKRQILTLVVLPQLTARTLPALTGQFASVIKDSSLLSVIAVIELTQTMREISAVNFKLFECYLFLGVLYLVLTLPVSLMSKRLERRFAFAA
ncbi:MAG: amino acid ABC transporter permease [Peptococcaceae bacterium]|nr:amino acid ABC transporter permease [Peptococcaceae bacterium]